MAFRAQQCMLHSSDPIDLNCLKQIYDLSGG